MMLAWRPDLGAERLVYAGATLWTAASFSITPLETRSGVLLSPVRLVGTAVAVGAAPGEAWVVVRPSRRTVARPTHRPAVPAIYRALRVGRVGLEPTTLGLKVPCSTS